MGARLPVSRFVGSLGSSLFTLLLGFNLSFPVAAHADAKTDWKKTGIDFRFVEKEFDRCYESDTRFLACATAIDDMIGQRGKTRLPP